MCSNPSITWQVPWHSGLSFLIWEMELVVKINAKSIPVWKPSGYLSISLVLISLAFKFFHLMAPTLTPALVMHLNPYLGFLDLVSILSSYLDSFFQHKDPYQSPELDTSLCSKGNLDIHCQSTPVSLEGCFAGTWTFHLPHPVLILSLENVHLQGHTTIRSRASVALTGFTRASVENYTMTSSSPHRLCFHLEMCFGALFLSTALCISLGGVFHIYYDANGVPRALWGIACMAIYSRLFMLTPGTDPSLRLLRKERTVLLGRQSTGYVKLDPTDGLETLLYCDNVVWLLIPEVQRQSGDVGHVL